MAKLTDLEIPFALKDGVLKEPSEVESGLACGCVCPVCGTNVVARKGSKVRHHFAHQAQGDCQGALETSIHLAAKEIFNQAKHMRLPDVKLHFPSNRASMKVAKDPQILISDVHVEKRLEGIVPDIILISNGRELMVEIGVTHMVDRVKAEKIKKMGVSAIEIDLSKIDRTISKESLKEILIENVANKHWVYNAATDSLLKNLLNKTKSMPIISRGFALHVDYCPIEARIWQGKPYANYIDDCLACEYCFEGGKESIKCAGEGRLDPQTMIEGSQQCF